MSSWGSVLSRDLSESLPTPEVFHLSFPDLVTDDRPNHKQAICDLGNVTSHILGAIDILSMPISKHHLLTPRATVS